MEKGVWLDYSGIVLEDKQRVLICRHGYGRNYDLCVYNQYYSCFDDADGMIFSVHQWMWIRYL